MLQDALNIFTKEFYKFLTGYEEVNSMLIKKHSVDLQNNGEFSFPNTVKSWHRYINMKSKDNVQTLLTYIGKDSFDINEESIKWILWLERTIEIKERVHLFLNRPLAIKVGLSEGLVNNNVILQTLMTNISAVDIDPHCEKYCTTCLRLQCMKNVINNFLAISIKDFAEVSSMVITSKSSSKEYKAKFILCGIVLNAETNLKETKFSAEEFIRLRQNELTLIAQHKYGIRVSTDFIWKGFIAHLGESAVTFELLQTRPSSAVKINFNASSRSSKGAAFILYNCARLETILRTYSEKVEDGTYPPLPDFKNINFSLLTQEDEWCLIFNYIMGLPSLLKNCMEVNEHVCEFRPHLLCGFLSSMVKLISQYYRKTRILTEPRKHLLPVMFARLHMLNILSETLKTCLKLLNIKSVSQM